MKNIQENYHHLSKNLLKVIENSGMTVTQFAKVAHVSRNLIDSIICGEFRGSSSGLLAQIARADNVPFESLFENPNQVAPYSDSTITLVENDELRPLKDIINEIFLHAIKFCDGDKSKAAADLGVACATLYRTVGADREWIVKRRLNNRLKYKRQ